MSTFLSTVHLPAVAPLWPRARRLLALAFVAAVGAVVASGTTAPHALATAAVHVRRWLAGLSELDVFVAMIGLFLVVVGIAVATAVDDENSREVFDVR